ncbi:MAG: hypothetical protein JWP36_2753 [Paucimonas sp.]|nr:hypothetical protein [Paucimonas sp.]
MKPTRPDLSLPAQQRKKLVLLQGQLFRLGMMEAQKTLAIQLQPQALLNRVFTQAVDSGVDAARGLLSPAALLDGRFVALLPVVSKAVGMLRRRRLLVPAALTVAAAAAGYVGWKAFSRWRATSPTRPAAKT